MSLAGEPLALAPGGGVSAWAYDLPHWLDGHRHARLRHILQCTAPYKDRPWGGTLGEVEISGEILYPVARSKNILTFTSSFLTFTRAYVYNTFYSIYCKTGFESVCKQTSFKQITHFCVCMGGDGFLLKWITVFLALSGSSFVYYKEESWYLR